MDSSERTIKAIEKRAAAIQQKVHPCLPELLTAFREAEEARKSLSVPELTPERIQNIKQELDRELDRI